MDNEKTDRRFPVISLEILQALDERFKNQCPNLNDSDRQIWYDAGARAVVNFLAAQYEQQNENILFPEN